MKSWADFNGFETIWPWSPQAATIDAELPFRSDLAPEVPLP